MRDSIREPLRTFKSDNGAGNHGDGKNAAADRSRNPGDRRPVCSIGLGKASVLLRRTSGFPAAESGGRTGYRRSRSTDFLSDRRTSSHLDRTSTLAYWVNIFREDGFGEMYSVHGP